MHLDLRAFGPLEVSRDGANVQIGSPLRRVLLALLIAHHGRVVPASTLAERLWPVRPPAIVAKSLQIHVHRLRRLLGGARTVLHRPPGYSLGLPRASIDIYRFEDIAKQGHAALAGGDHVTAAELLRQAIALYRGPAFQGLDDVDGLVIESHRLAEVRLAALGGRIAAELELGEHATLVPELEALVAEHPLHEHFRADLMLALYRSGRRVQALAVYQAGQKLLMEEIGVEPDVECQALARAILTSDSSLNRPPRHPARRATAQPSVPGRLVSSYIHLPRSKSAAVGVGREGAPAVDA